MRSTITVNLVDLPGAVGAFVSASRRGVTPFKTKAL